MNIAPSTLLLCLALALALTACGRQEPSGLAPAQGTGRRPRRRRSRRTGSGRYGQDRGRRREAVDDDASERRRLRNRRGNARRQRRAQPVAGGSRLDGCGCDVQTAAAAASGTQWQDGVNYTRIVPAQPTAVPAGQVEVLEFFWYACPHCYAIDHAGRPGSRPSRPTSASRASRWNGTKAIDRWRAFITRWRAMGKLDQLHSEIFKEIQVNGDPLMGADPNNAAAAERMQLAFIKRSGLSDADFEKAYHAMTSKLRCSGPTNWCSAIASPPCRRSS